MPSNLFHINRAPVLEWGGTSQFPITRAGDAHHTTYLRLFFPGLRGHTLESGQSHYPVASNWCDPCGDGIEVNLCDTETPQEEPDCPLDTCVGIEGPWATYTNGAAIACVRQISCVIGANQIDEETYWSNMMYQDVCGMPGKDYGEMVHIYPSLPMLINASHRSDGSVCYLPLKFHWCLAAGNALNLTSMNWHSMIYTVTFAPLTDLIQVDSDTTVPIICQTGMEITVNDIQAEIVSHVVHLDIGERDRLSGATYSQLMRQRQHHEKYFVANESVDFRLTMNFAVAFIQFCVQRECQESVNNWFNWWGKYGTDPIQTAYMRFNNQARTLQLDYMYWRLVTPDSYGNRLPQQCTYTMPFCVDCSRTKPTLW